MTERRKKERAHKLQCVEVRLSYEDTADVRQVVSAQVMETSEGGMGVQSNAHLAPGLLVAIRSSGQFPSRARVQWCLQVRAGQFRAGLAFDNVNHERVAPPPAFEEISDDLYELLQVNPKADLDTIHRIYRLQAQRFHPDNGETGDEERFKQILRAYRVLSDPEQRAAYDARYRTTERNRWRLFDTPEEAKGVSAERRKRLGVLSLLYKRRVMQPDQPAISMFELEELLGIPREHLEFTFWYLKENGLVLRGDNNKYQITIKGVDHAEEHAAAWLAGEQRLLPAPAQQSA
jgi:curved DNA-binding protein